VRNHLKDISEPIEINDRYLINHNILNEDATIVFTPAFSSYSSDVLLIKDRHLLVQRVKKLSYERGFAATVLICSGEGKAKIQCEKGIKTYFHKKQKNKEDKVCCPFSLIYNRYFPDP
jgi:hypothetical protein